MNLLKYIDTEIVLREIPNEITLAINISNCPHRCDGCHSSYLQKDIGTILKEENLVNLIKTNIGITCVCFMGGDSNPMYLNKLAKIIKENNLKVGYYSGNTQLSEHIDLSNFDYIKLGPYIKDKGPLNMPTTNQRFYEVIPMVKEGNTLYTLVDKTSTLW